MQSDEDHAYIRWKSWEKSDFAKLHTKDRLTFSAELRKANVKLTDESNVMELGFGNGAFARFVLEKTRHYVGIEENTELVARATELKIEAHEASDDLSLAAAGRQFDLIAAFDVFEHIPLQGGLNLLKSARKHLSPNGRILLRLPSGDSPFFGHLMYGDITHKTQLGTYAFHQIAELTSLSVVTIHAPAFPIFGMGLTIALRRMVVVLFRSLVNAVLRIAYYAGEPVVLEPTMVVVFSKEVK